MTPQTRWLTSDVVSNAVVHQRRRRDPRPDNSPALLPAGLVGVGLLLVLYSFRLMNRECGD